MKILDTSIEGLKIIKHNNFKDKRGSLRVVYDKRLLNKNFCFEYCTTSKKNSLRGFHFQFKYQQAKYVTVLKGKILDCVVDLRKNSKTFGKSFKIILSSNNNLSMYIPEGFGHAYYSFDEENIVYYKLNNFYKPQYEDGIIASDKKLNIKWPSGKKIYSKKDLKLKTFKDFKDIYKFL